MSLVAIGDGIERYLWSMGDGGMVQGAEAQYTYNQVGNFKVELMFWGKMPAIGPFL